MNDELSGRDLDRALAEAMGWEQREVAYVGGKMVRVEPSRWSSWFDPNRQDGERFVGGIPNFHLSLDALYEGPERVLREAGWWLVSEKKSDFNEGQDWGAEWSNLDGTHEVKSRAQDEPTTRARAALAALRALRAPAEEAGRE